MEKIAVIGKGGREHALMRQLTVSGSEVIGIPGNPGMLEHGLCYHNESLEDVAELAKFIKREGFSLAVVGPEQPLVDGLTDELEDLDVPTFGPSAGASQLEGSKVFMKQIVSAADVPTAEWDYFTDPRQAMGYYERFADGAVIKTDGLAAGKGVILPKDKQEARAAIKEYLSGQAHGEAGERIVIEEKLRGQEISLFVLCDGEKGIPLGVARDYKRLKDGDEGPNTGGMGSYAPVDGYPPEFIRELMDIGVDPTLDFMREHGMPYKGVLYAGFMLTEEGPKLLEYNIRFGDPEAQVVLPRLKSDLVQHAKEAAEGKLVTPVEFDPVHAVTVTLAAKGYPERPVTGDRIEGIEYFETMEDVVLFHGGTTRKNGKLVVDGGRVLYPTGFGKTREEAKSRADAAADVLDWPGRQRRKDIAS